VTLDGGGVMVPMRCALQAASRAAETSDSGTESGSEVFMR
jgi:hypothetical protein